MIEDKLASYCSERSVRFAKANRNFRIKVAITTLAMPVQLVRARGMARSGRPVKLHLGSQDVHLDGWINVDLWSPGRKRELVWDLRRRLPFPANAADVVYMQHVFDQFPLQEALHLAEECVRVLKPGGVFRICTPDLALHIQGYVSGDDRVLKQRYIVPVGNVPGLALNELFYCGGHRTVYDIELLETLLLSAGFTRVEKSSYQEGALQPSPDTPDKPDHSFYAEAFK